VSVGGCDEKRDEKPALINDDDELYWNRDDPSKRRELTDFWGLYLDRIIRRHDNEASETKLWKHNEHHTKGSQSQFTAVQRE
jgi:hypothetical protein